MRRGTGFCLPGGETEYDVDKRENGEKSRQVRMRLEAGWSATQETTVRAVAGGFVICGGYDAPRFESNAGARPQDLIAS